MDEMINKKNVGKGVFYLYLEAISAMLSGFLFWFILSKITSPEVIGISSTIISIIMIFSIVSVIGMQGGIQRYLVKSLTEKRIEDVRGIINSAVLIVSLGIFGSSIFILVFRDFLFGSLNLDFSLSIFLIVTLGLATIAALLRSINTSAMQTKSITTSSILSTVVKLSIALILVPIGFEVYGILIAYILSLIVTCALLYATLKRKILNQSENQSDQKTDVGSFRLMREIFTAGTTFWIPSSISATGSHLGTILVYVAENAASAGIYFLTFSIVTGITMINSVLSTIAYPAISAMQDGRKGAVWRFIKISFILTLPISFAIIFYSKEVLALFGSGYTGGSSYLQILLLSIVPTTIISGVGVLAYAYSNNRQVLSIGLFTSFPRIFLCFIFIPLFGGNGAAFVYLFGSVIGCIVSCVVAKRLGLKIFWKEIVIMLIIPAILLALFKYSGVNYMLGIFATLVLSYAMFSVFRIINKEDIEDILKILPPNISNFLRIILRKISGKVYKR